MSIGDHQNLIATFTIVWEICPDFKQGSSSIQFFRSGHISLMIVNSVMRFWESPMVIIYPNRWKIVGRIEHIYKDFLIALPV